jgi:hypothetical protein
MNKRISMSAVVPWIAMAITLAITSCGTGASKEPTVVGAEGPPGYPPFQLCPASSSWVTQPNPPAEIGGSGVPVGQETFCQFYQFAEQWFLALVSPSSTPGSRVFETFNVVGQSGTTDCPTAGSKQPRLTGKEALQKALFARLEKPRTADFDPTLPADLNQATGQGLYDQNGNVVLYAMLYNSTECQATSAGFAPNTIEVKTSWRILSAPDPTYYTMTATVSFPPPTGPQTLLLGLVGFHMAINTALHPEFIWATFEHKSNAPDCNKPQPTPAAGWSFTSSAAAQCLANGGIDNCPSYNFNQGAAATSPKGTPNQVCRTYADGTDAVPVGPNGNRNSLNAFTIDTLNDQLVGPGGYLTKLPASDPMAVFANYTMQGAIWTNGGQDSTEANQRGSLELANTTMETFVQSPPPKTNTNCFGCHNFSTQTPLDVSHIYQGASAKAAALKRQGGRKK